MALVSFLVAATTYHARLAPRGVASVEDDLLFFDLWIGQRMVGSYDPRQQQWEIQRPFHLLVDEGALPGALPGATAGSDTPTPPSPALPDCTPQSS